MPGLLIRLQRRIFWNQSITFTPPGTRFIFLTLAVGFSALNTGNNLLYLIVGLMLSLIIVSGILSGQTLRGLVFEWSFPPRLFVRQPAETRLRISNAKRFLPSFSFHLEEADRSGGSHYIFKLSPKQSTLRNLSIEYGRRGLQQRPSLAVRTTFPFGLIDKMKVHQDGRRVLVYPRVHPLPPGFMLAGSAAGLAENHRERGRGGDLHNLRGYTSADDARSIHWKASARESKLLLKEYEREEDRRVVLVVSNHLPLERGVARPARFHYEEEFERAIEIAASLSVELDRRGFDLGLQTLSADDGIPGSRNLDAILGMLALLPPFNPEDDQKLEERIRAVAGGGLSGGNRVLVLPFQDPAWDSVRGGFAEVWAADDPRFKEWLQT
ncbi:MAG TPA: DUF58 domain-containing protein [Nitrospiria bacterium]